MGIFEREREREEVEVEKRAPPPFEIRSSQFFNADFRARSLPFDPLSAFLSTQVHTSCSSLATYMHKNNKKRLTLIPLVAALKSLQNAMMLSPACPSAGPTGGAGLAWPAPIRRRIDAEMAFLDIGERNMEPSREQSRAAGGSLSFSLVERKDRHRVKSEQAGQSKGEKLTSTRLFTTQFAGHSKPSFPFFLSR